MPPVCCACACIELRTQPVPTDRCGPAAPTCRRRPSPCCAAFALGATSSGNACPAKYARLDSMDGCKSAADVASRTYGGSVAYSYYPNGCYWHTIAGSVYYNSNASGAANIYAQPLCAGAALQANLLGHSTRIVSRTHGRLAGAAATVPAFSPAGGMLHRRLPMLATGVLRVCMHCSP